jgi:hypothetical protein
VEHPFRKPPSRPASASRERSAPTPPDNAPQAQKALPMADNAHHTDHEPRTVTRDNGDARGWFAYSPTRQQWRSLTPSGALAYHADAREAELHLRHSLPSGYRPSPRP